MRAAHIRSVTVVVIVCLAALVTVAGCGGDSDDETTSAASGSSSPITYDDEHAYAEAKKISAKLVAYDNIEPLPEDTAWATSKYITSYNDRLRTLKDAGATKKGSVTTTATYLAESNPTAAAGWDLTIYRCSVSTARLYIDGKDVSADPTDPTKRLPKGPHRNVHLLSFTTADMGKTWQLDKVQFLAGERAEKSSCPT